MRPSGADTAEVGVARVVCDKWNSLHAPETGGSCPGFAGEFPVSDAIEKQAGTCVPKRVTCEISRSVPY